MLRNEVVQPLLVLWLELGQEAPREVLEGRKGGAFHSLAVPGNEPMQLRPSWPIHLISSAARPAIAVHMRAAFCVLKVHDVVTVVDHEG